MRVFTLADSLTAGVYIFFKRVTNEKIMVGADTVVCVVFLRSVFRGTGPGQGSRVKKALGKKTAL